MKLLWQTIILFIAIPCFAFAQPANDDCINAISITPSVNTTCTLTAGTTAGVISSDYDPCMEFEKRNVWYKFTATAANHIVQLTFGTMQNGIVDVFTGDCGSRVSVNTCNSASAGPVVQKILGGLTVGQEYLIAVSTSEQNEEGTFDICVTTPPPPANDDCNNAVSLTINPSNIPDIRMAGNTQFATQSLPACTGTADDDVWFSFTAAQSSHRIHLFYSSSFFSAQAFSGSCGSLISIACASPSGNFKTLPLTGLTTGQVYFIRVYSNSSSASAQGNFSIAITSSPLNDACSNATAVTPSANGSDACSSMAAGGTFDATQSSTDCFGGNATSNDTWFNFTATQSVHKIKVQGFGSNAVRFQVMSGSCAGLASLFCSVPTFVADTAMTTVGGLTTGQTYFVRVYSGNSGGVEGLFNVCITSPFFPNNDDCINAVTLMPASDSTTNYINSTTIGATNVSISGTCNNAALDVWYKFTASAVQHVVKAINLTNIGSLKMELFSGGCGGLVQQRCNSLSTDTIFGIGNLIIGQTYFVRIYNNSLLNGDDFKIAIITPQALSNDECNNAISISPTADASCDEAGGTILGATQSQKDNCGGNAFIGQVSDVWYKFIASSVSHRVRLIKGTGTVAFQTFSGNCNSLLSLGCSSELTGTAGTGTEVRYDGLTIGNTYFIRVLNTSPSTAGTFDLCVKTVVVPANNECSSPATLTPQSDITFAVFSAGSTIDATQSSQATNCSAGQDDDVWYQFTATQNNMQVVLQNGSIAQTRVVVYSGTCAALALVKCQTGNVRDNVVPLTGLTVGNTYLARVYSSSTSATAQGTFSIMVTAQFNPPANDDCINAIELFASSNNSCNAVKGSTIDAGASGNSTCINGNEVWYKFTATATSHRINVEGFASTPTVTAFSGSCAGLVQVPSACAVGSSQVSVTAGSLTIGNIYFVKVLTNSNESFKQSIFNICITTPQVPSNDLCSNAIGLTINSNSETESAALFSTNLATFTGTPNCPVVANDVWFSFAAASNPVTIEVAALNTEAAIELLSGTCGSLTSVLCNGDDPTRLSNILNANGLVQGATYFIRVSSTSFSTALQFKIKVYENASQKINTSIDSVCLTANLVQNPGLETDFFFPTSFISAADPGREIISKWRVPTRGTSDFFNGLNTAGSAVEVPNNLCFGNQSARNGYGYGGFFAYVSSSGSYREYLENELSQPLVPGKKYLVSMYLSLADFSTIAVDNIGIAFRNEQTKEMSFANLSYTPMVVSPDNVFLSDKKAWVNVSAVITAGQACKYLVIGNFKNNAQTDTVRLIDTTGLLSGGTFAGCATTSHTAYYFVDDVVVSEINQAAAPQCSLTPLPLSLLEFSGSKNGQTVYLKWKTIYERNAGHFEIERSADGSLFKTINVVKATGNSRTVQTYSFADADLPSGTIYYRLKITDADGSFRYSQVVRIRPFNREESIQLMPNPAVNKAMLQVPDLLSGAMVTITAADGKLMNRQLMTGVTMHLDIHTWPAGVYFIHVQKGKTNSSHKLIKQ